MANVKGQIDWARRAGGRLLGDAWRTWWDLFKLMAPIVVLTKLLHEAGLIGYLAAALSPVMRLVGLPGEMGLVWASALLTNIYGGIVVFAELAGEVSLTSAQSTVLVVMILTAHALPVELAIARKSGVRVRAMLLIRGCGALFFGFVLHRIYTAGGYLQGPNVMLWRAGVPDSSLWGWALRQGANMAMIFAVIVILLLVLKVLKRIGVEAAVTKLLEPLLERLGMSKDAAPITIIGMTMGLTYGGGLIIKEAKSGRLSRRDVLFSMTLMGLCHSLIEDTLVMSTLGAHHSGLVWGRLVLTFLSVFVFAKVFALLPEGAKRHLFVRAPALE